MKRAAVLLLAMLGVPCVYGQHSQGSAHPPDRYPLCEVSPGSAGPYRCPNSSCGEEYNNPIDYGACTSQQGACTFLNPIHICCGAYANYITGSGCAVAEMRDPRVQSHILELAERSQILVPTCSGAYVPARIAFRQYKEKEDKENGGF
jgi:hypothetical protein